MENDVKLEAVNYKKHPELSIQLEAINVDDFNIVKIENIKGLKFEPTINGEAEQEKSRSKSTNRTSKTAREPPKQKQSKSLPVPSYACQYCRKFCSTETELDQHELKHTLNKELSCPDCGMGFARRSYLAEHACIHRGEKPHKCYYCNKLFTLRCNLVRHVRIHTGEKPFSCDICHKEFILKKNMLEHRRTHTGEKPFKCQYCEFSFSRRSSLVRHSRIHTGEKIYQCHDCGKTFSWKYYLRRHVGTHLKKKSRVRRRRRMKKVEETYSAPVIPAVQNDVAQTLIKEETFVAVQRTTYYNDHSYAMEETAHFCEVEGPLEITEFKEEIESDDELCQEVELMPPKEEPDNNFSTKSFTIVVPGVDPMFQSIIPSYTTEPQEHVMDLSGATKVRVSRNENESKFKKQPYVRLQRIPEVTSTPYI